MLYKRLYLIIVFITIFLISDISKGMPRPGRTYLNLQLFESLLVQLLVTSNVSAPMYKVLTLEVHNEVTIFDCGFHGDEVVIILGHGKLCTH